MSRGGTGTYKTFTDFMGRANEERPQTPQVNQEVAELSRNTYDVKLMLFSKDAFTGR